MKNVIVYREPKLKPFPPSLQLDVPGATLPVKIEAARRAIALCTDLPELLRYKQQAEGLAAAVKIIKTVAPEIVKSANSMVKEACFKIGELLNQYSEAGVQGPGYSSKKSERRKVSDSLGLSRSERNAYLRLGAAPDDLRKRVIADDKTPRGLKALERLVPPRDARKGRHRSEVYQRLLGLPSRPTLAQALSSCQRAAEIPIQDIRALAPDEKKMIRKKIAEIMEYLDIIDEACK